MDMEGGKGRGWQGGWGEEGEREKRKHNLKKESGESRELFLGVEVSPSNHKIGL